MCDVCNLVKQCFHVDDGHSLPEDTKLQLSRHLQSAHTLLEESSSHRNLCPFPLSDPASLTLPATPCPQRLPHISHQNQPPNQAGHSCTLFPERGYSVTEKSPSGRIESRFTLLFHLLFPENFYYFLQNCVYSAVTRHYTIVNRPSSEDEPVSDATVFLTKENSETTLFSLFTASINDVTTILNKTLKYMFNKY